MWSGSSFTGSGGGLGDISVSHGNSAFHEERSVSLPPPASLALRRPRRSSSPRRRYLIKSHEASATASAATMLAVMAVTTPGVRPSPLDLLPFPFPFPFPLDGGGAVERVSMGSGGLGRSTGGVPVSPPDFVARVTAGERGLISGMERSDGCQRTWIIMAQSLSLKGPTNVVPGTLLIA